MTFPSSGDKKNRDLRDPKKAPAGRPYRLTGPRKRPVGPAETVPSPRKRFRLIYGPTRGRHNAFGRQRQKTRKLLSTKTPLSDVVDLVEFFSFLKIMPNNGFMYMQA